MISNGSGRLPTSPSWSARGEGVTLYPLLLTPTPETALDLVRDKDPRPLRGRPFSSYAAGERDRQSYPNQ